MGINTANDWVVEEPVSLLCFVKILAYIIKSAMISNLNRIIALDNVWLLSMAVVNCFGSIPIYLITRKLMLCIFSIGNYERKSLTPGSLRYSTAQVLSTVYVLVSNWSK